MHHLHSLAPDAPESLAQQCAQPSDEMATLRGENVALQSLLYGLCLGLSQMGEVQREVICQAFDYADRAPMALALKELSRDGERSTSAFIATIANLRDLIMSRIRSVGL